MAAAIIITILIICYYVFYIGVLISLVPMLWAKLLLGLVPVLFGGVMIYVCLQRIHEFKGGEIDDLDNY